MNILSGSNFPYAGCAADPFENSQSGGEIVVDEIEFVHLSEVKKEKFIDLMNNEMVGKHLPLLVGEFSVENYRTFLNAKQQLWDEFGFGPWGFLVNGDFAGWGGLQPEHGEADFALILHPDYWGWGRRIFNKVRDQAFSEMNLKTITVLLPPGRPNSKAPSRFGFAEDGELTVGGHLFTRFRLTNYRV